MNERVFNQRIKDYVLERVKPRIANCKRIDKDANKAIEDCSKNDDPCDNSTHWIGKMNCNDKDL